MKRLIYILVISGLIISLIKKEVIAMDADIRKSKIEFNNNGKVAENDINNQEETKNVYNFDKQEQLIDWRIVNDSVMGGVSSSKVELTDKGILLFSGQVSLENNGGFASTRTYGSQHNLKDYEGILVRAKGDGKRYNFNFRNNLNWRSANFRMFFDTEENNWITIKIPFKKLKAVWRGQTYPEKIVFDPSNIVSLGILIADKQSGSFELEIDWIKAYK